MRREDACAPHDERRRPILVRQRCLERRFHGFDVPGVDLFHEGNAHRFDDGSDVNLVSLLALQRGAGAGMLLLARHCGDAVIENRHGDFGFVVDGCGQRREARMEEGAVTDGGDDALLPARLLEAVRHPDARPHRNEHIHRLERLQYAHRIAADVAGDDGLALLPGHIVEEGAVRTAGAQRRRARRHRHLNVRFFGQFLRRLLVEQARLQRALPHLLQRQLAAQREAILAVRHFDAGSQKLLLNEGIELLHDNQRSHLRGEIADGVQRQRIAHPQLEDGAAGENLARVLIRHAGRHDAQRLVAP